MVTIEPKAKSRQIIEIKLMKTKVAVSLKKSPKSNKIEMNKPAGTVFL